ncbi:unnamed protein product [Sphagnum tenellum]
MLLGKGHQQEGPMVRLLSYTGRAGLDTDEGPKRDCEDPQCHWRQWLAHPVFDSASSVSGLQSAICISMSHSGVRDYLCNRMYSLPLSVLVQRVVYSRHPSSRRLLPLTSTTPPQRTPPPVPLPTMADEGFREANRPPVDETESSLKVLKKSSPLRRSVMLYEEIQGEGGEGGEGRGGVATERAIKETDSESFFKRLFRDKDEDEKGVRSDELVHPEEDIVAGALSELEHPVVINPETSPGNDNLFSSGSS